MNKKMIAGVVAGCVVTVVVAGVVTARRRELRPAMWDRMRERIESMPEDFPPRIVIDNVRATRANTERILDLLTAEREHADELVTPA